jgi:hypothetical protein
VFKPTAVLLAVFVSAAFALAAGTAAASSAAPGPAAQPWFEERTEAAGVAHRHVNRSFHNPYAHIMEGYTALGASAAVADFDGDGWEDLFVTDSQEKGSNHLYRNRGDFTFEDVADAAGVAAGNDAANASADALWLDRDDDGDPDLLVVRFGQSLLFDNRGDGTFRDVTAAAGLTGYRNSITAIAFDYDLDGDQDLLFGNYFAPVDLFDPATPRFFPESFETAANGGGLTLYRNRGDGTFEDVTKEAGLAEHTGWTLDVGHADYDWDGDDDLYVASDFGTDRFFVNDGDGTFTDATESAIGIDTKKGMNAEWADFDRDGLFDVFVTNITDEYMREGNFLWHNEGDGTFTDLAKETGTWDTGWAWGGKFFDADNDGWLDLFVANGWVSAGEGNYVLDIFQLILKPDADLADARNWPAMGDKSLSGYQHDAFLVNRGGTLFENRGAEHGLDSQRDGRGVAVADFDRDGRPDLFVANADDLPHLWRNTAPPDNAWVAFELTGAAADGVGDGDDRRPGSNRQAVGARLRLTAGGATRVAFVDGGNGFAGQSSRRVHFGLGGATKVDRLEVLWPSGLRQTFDDLEPRHLYTLREGGEPCIAPAPKPTAAQPAPPPLPKAGAASGGSAPAAEEVSPTSSGTTRAESTRPEPLAL